MRYAEKVFSDSGYSSYPWVFPSADIFRSLKTLFMPDQAY
jgi:hypothetical protein